MDPATRTLLKVNVEDAMLCDQLFDILMEIKWIPDVISLKQTLYMQQILIHKQKELSKSEGSFSFEENFFLM